MPWSPAKASLLVQDERGFFPEAQVQRAIVQELVYREHLVCDDSRHFNAVEFYDEAYVTLLSDGHPTLREECQVGWIRPLTFLQLRAASLRLANTTLRRERRRRSNWLKTHWRHLASVLIGRDDVRENALLNLIHELSADDAELFETELWRRNYGFSSADAAQSLKISIGVYAQRLQRIVAVIRRCLKI